MELNYSTSTYELLADVNKPVLSLCIPTYNRRDKLTRLLNGIKQDIEDAAGKIEVCISDNASTDGTNEFLTALSSQKYIRVTRQSENLGFRKNYTAVLSMTRGNYIWSLGDDDVVIENGLKHLLQLLQDESPDYVFVHIASVDSDIPNYFKNIKPGKYSANTFHSMLCNKGLDMFGFIGSHIFPRHSYNVLSTSNELITSGWPHLAILLDASDTMKSFFVTPPLARQIGDGLFWSQTNWILVNMKKIDILQHYKPKWADKNFNFFFIITKTFLTRIPISDLALAKILEPSRFSEIVDKANYYFKKNKGTLKYIILLYLILTWVLKYSPIGFILSKLKPTYYRNKMKEYLISYTMKSSIEAYSREPSN